MSRIRIIVIIITILSGIDIGLLWSGGETSLAHTPAPGSVQVEPITNTAELQPAAQGASATVVEIRPPNSIVDALTAAGTIELINKQQVVLAVDGLVRRVAVNVGDAVKAGDLLLVLDTTDLDRGVDRATLDLQTAQADLAKLKEDSSPGEIAVAEANLHAAQVNLLKAQAGPSKAELAAAQSKLASTQAKYQELQAPPSGAEVDEVKAELEKAEIDRQNAQREYDKIKWRNDKGMTPESAALYKATVEYERVQAKANRINQPSAQSNLQDALSNIEKAQSDLQLLRQKPSAADIADAQAKVIDAQQKLDKLKTGPSAAQLESAEAKVEKAQLDVEEANAKVKNAQVLAPSDGTVLELPLAAGERGSVGKVVASLANTQQLKLTVKVAEVDITKIAIGQQAQIAIDALRGHKFAGVIENIAPINQSDKDVVNYPVTIRLTDPALDGVRPGMNAVATLTNAEMTTNSWLAPSSALRQEKDGSTIVMVQSGETFTAIPVTPSEVQGEWTLVQSPALHKGDKVLGQVASYVDEQATPGINGGS